MIKAEPSWEQALAQGISKPAELLDLLGLSEADLRWPIDANSAFKTKVPHAFVARMRHGDPLDPLLLQVLASMEERQPVAGFSAEPLGESARIKAPGLISKYAHRVLLTLTGACAIHCRYCFRRNFAYSDTLPGHHDWQRTYDYIANDATIEEIILSGGDPLTLKDDRLAMHIEALAGIEHITTLRIHTRTPVVLPQRVTVELLTALSRWPKLLVVVVHCNHPAELDAASCNALRQLAEASHALLNQSVLLAEVNDDAAVLAALSKRLLAARTVPYYLHALDKVAGAAHFAVADERAERLMVELRAMLPGYLVPRFVREVPGEPNKMPL